jgi:photosystem II stability/assembly factor-like uncharacterized protein
MNTGRLIFLLIALILLPIASLHAWEIVPGRTNVNSVAADANEQKLVVFLQYGGYWLSEDGGQNWLPINEAVNPDNRAAFSQDIAVVDALADTIVTRNSFWDFPVRNRPRKQMSMSADGGQSWELPSVQGHTTNNEFMIVNHADHQNLMYLSSDHLYRSFDFGLTWSESIEVDWRANQKSSFVQDAANDSGWFITSYLFQNQPSGVILSTDNGETWEGAFEPQEVYSQYDMIDMPDIDRLSNGDLLVTVGSSVSNNQPLDSFLRSTDDGDTWVEEYPLPENFIPMQLIESAGDPGYLLVAGRHGFTRGLHYLYESQDFGHHFRPLQSDALESVISPAYLSNNQFNSATYVSTEGNGAWKTADGGETWTEFPTPEVGSLSRSVIREEFTSHVSEVGATVYVKRDTDPDYFTFDYPYPSSDSTQTAFPLLSAQGDLLRGAVLRVSIATREGYFYVAESDDGGLTWMDPIVSIPYSFFIHEHPLSYCLDNGQHYYFLTGLINDSNDWGAYISSDEGLTWSTVEIIVQGSVPQAFYTVKDDYIYAVRYGDGVDRKPIGGGEWESLNHPNPTYLHATNASVIDEEIEGMYTFSSVFGYKYLDGEWEQLGVLPYPSVGFAGAIPQPGTDPVLFVTTFGNPHVYVSYDGGYEWDVIANPQPFESQMMRTNNVIYDQWRNRLWLNTPLGMMWEDAALFTGVEETDPQVPTTHELLHVYPNPFNSQATVMVRLDQPHDVTLTLFNTLGQEVRTLVDERMVAGEHAVAIETDGLASGTYFVRLMTVDGLAATRKIELVR